MQAYSNSESQQPTYESPYRLKIHKTDSLQSYVPSQQKLYSMQIRRKIFIYSANDGNADIRMAFFALLFKCMTMPEAKNRLLYESIKESFQRDNQEVRQRMNRKLDEAFGLSDVTVETVLVWLWNQCAGFDDMVVGRVKVELLRHGKMDRNVRDVVEWMECYYRTSLEVRSFEESMISNHRPDLIQYKDQVIKQSSKPIPIESESQSDSFLSIPKKDQESDIMELTLSKSPLLKEEQQIPVSRPIRPASPPRPRSFWDILCCNQ